MPRPTNYPPTLHDLSFSAASALAHPWLQGTQRLSTMSVLTVGSLRPEYRDRRRKERDQGIDHGRPFAQMKIEEVRLRYRCSSISSPMVACGMATGLGRSHCARGRCGHPLPLGIEWLVDRGSSLLTSQVSVETFDDWSLLVLCSWLAGWVSGWVGLPAQPTSSAPGLRCHVEETPAPHPCPP